MAMSYNIGMEAIDFQADNLKKILAFHIGELRKLSKEELLREGTYAVLSAEIKKTTNLNTTIIVDQLYGSAAVMVPDVNRNNPLVNDMNKGYLPNATGFKLVENARNVIKGTVNLKKARVDGVYANLDHTVFLPLTDMLSERFTDEEIVAVLLHEIGHIFVYYEYISRTVTTNTVLAGIAKTMSSTTDPKEIETVLLSAKKVLQLTDLDVKKLVNNSRVDLVEMVVVSSAIEQARSELGSDIYDMNSFEALADNFATRLGCGRELVTALDKYYRSGNDMALRTLPTYLALEAIKLLSLGLSTVIVAATVTSIAGAAPAGIMIILTTIFLVGNDLNTKDYDRPLFRLKRIKEQLVERMKDKRASKEERKQLAESVEHIDGLLKDYNTRTSVLVKLAAVVSTSVRNRYKQEQLQSELESLASNELFEFYNAQNTGVK